MIDKHVNNISVCGNGLWALRNISDNGTILSDYFSTANFFIDYNKKRRWEIKIFNLISDAMKKHINDADLCLNGLIILSNFTSKNGKLNI